ncbi:hypothetical protein PJN34_27305, partial [Mycobacterium kansasii]
TAPSGPTLQTPALATDSSQPSPGRDSREAAHLQAFQAYAAHAQELALHQAHSAADPNTQRAAIADWLYWQHVAGLLDSALCNAS